MKHTTQTCEVCGKEMTNFYTPRQFCSLDCWAEAAPDSLADADEVIMADDVRFAIITNDLDEEE